MHAVYEPPLWITQETSRANPDFHHGLLGGLLRIDRHPLAIRARHQGSGGIELTAHAWARSRSSLRSRALRVSDAARSNSARASLRRLSFLRRSPRTLGNRW